ncbi:hypothetical protein [Brucella anthropi]|uniref:hypothetical protein n=1 Tax=Brucella anthropi TaxID=529 RepID=UPI000CFD8174|nr:hypothetical protein [Ochrobactrum sp. MYb49]PQZ63085.1 hypothetical protein CQ057_16835 [Ochrobactrum sp. MYb49]
MADKQTVKVGDRITAKLDDSYKDYRAGDTFYVQEIDEQNGETIVVFTDNVGDKRYRRVGEFTVEHVPVAVATGKPVFKVGDRVVALKDSAYSIKKGSISTVVRVNGDHISIRKENGEADGWLAEYFALAPSFTIEAGKFYRTRDGRKVGPMGAWYDDGSCFNSTDYLNGGLWKPNGEAYFSKAKDSPTLIAEWVDEPASNDNLPSTTPAIVALIEGGQPKPSEQPKVHKSEQAATDEAERLAVKYPGQKFGVFVLADSRIADVVIRRAA